MYNVANVTKVRWTITLGDALYSWISL